MKAETKKKITKEVLEWLGAIAILALLLAYPVFHMWFLSGWMDAAEQIRLNPRLPKPMSTQEPIKVKSEADSPN